MNRRPRNRGITIVELMVVMAIVAMIMGIGVMSLGSIGAGALKADSNRLSSTMKYAYASAAVNNSHYRLVIDFETNGYHTEVANSALVSSTNTEADNELLTEEARELAEKDEKENDLFDEEEDNPFGINRKVSFDRVQDAVVEPQKLKEGHRFERMVTAAGEIATGKGVVNFYPNGFQDQVAIVIKDEDGKAFTLLTEPLSGSIKTYSQDKEIEDDFFEVEDDD